MTYPISDNFIKALTELKGKVAELKVKLNIPAQDCYVQFLSEQYIPINEEIPVSRIRLKVFVNTKSANINSIPKIATINLEVEPTSYNMNFISDSLENLLPAR